MIRIALGVAATVLALSGQARADWRFTHWNMTESALQTAAAKSGVTLTHTTDQEESDHGGPTISETGKSPDHRASLAYWKADMPSYFKSTVYFLLDDGKNLVQVSVIVPADQCRALDRALIAEYGNPTSNWADNSPGGISAAIWQTPGKDNIWFMWQNPLPGSPAIGVTCTSDWTP